MTELGGVDVYVSWPSRSPNELGEFLTRVNGDGLTLRMRSSRGVRVWPDGMHETFCTDSFRCRFLGSGVTPAQVISLLARLNDARVDVTKTAYLRKYDGAPGFTE